MSDIVERLRNGIKAATLNDWDFERTEADMAEAADEITRLRAEVERLRAEAVGQYTDGLHDGADAAADTWEKQIAALTARVAQLEGALQAWDDAVRIDVVMEGPRYMGVDYRRGFIAWEKTCAALTQPAQPVPEKGGE
jgi:phage host-nuclease inhibitor protein Gam